MKRADIQVGQEYAHSRDREWRTRAGRPAQVIVVDLGPFAKETGLWSRREPNDVTLSDGEVVKSFDARNPTGREKTTPLIAVRFLDESHGDEIKFVSTTSIVGPWGEAFAEWERAREAQKARYAAERQARDQLTVAADRLAELLAAIGINVIRFKLAETFKAADMHKIADIIARDGRDA